MESKGDGAPDLGAMPFLFFNIFIGGMVLQIVLLPVGKGAFIRSMLKPTGKLLPNTQACFPTRTLQNRVWGGSRHVFPEK